MSLVSFLCSDGVQFYHWQRADLQYADYPYAKFNVKAEPIRYSDEEYTSYLVNSKWSRSETDYLMILCHRHDLRWPIIFDRYALEPRRGSDELQNRYYEVVSTLYNKRNGIVTDERDSSLEATASSSGRKATINPTAERERR